MYKYSVLMSLYAKEKPEYLRAAIDSMLKQTALPDEIIIVKDGPLSEDLCNIVNEYKSKYPNLFLVISSETNLGLGKALNLGLMYCNNDLVARMDTDDISKPDRCEKQLIAFKENPRLDLLGSFIDEFYISTNEVVCSRTVPTKHNDIYEFAKRRSAFNHPTVMYKKSKVIEVGGYGDLRRNQDVDLFGRMLFSGCFTGNINESLLYFRSNNELAKRRKGWENTKSYIGTIRKFWKMGYSSFGDYFLVVIAQMSIFVMPVKLQQWVYKRFLRK